MASNLVALSNGFQPNQGTPFQQQNVGWWTQTGASIKRESYHGSPDLDPQSSQGNLLIQRLLGVQGMHVHVAKACKGCCWSNRLLYATITRTVIIT